MIPRIVLPVLLALVLSAQPALADYSADDGMGMPPLTYYGPVTAYSYGTRTASGLPVSVGMAACPSWVAFHTMIAIEGLGSYVCEDRGGAIVGTAIDIYIPSYAQAIRFGRQWRTWRLVWCSDHECQE